MDFYLGGDLYHWINKKKRVEEDEVKVMMIELSLAIDCLHEKGIIYRDLKVASLDAARKRDDRLAGTHQAGRLRTKQEAALQKLQHALVRRDERIHVAGSHG